MPKVNENPGLLADPVSVLIVGGKFVQQPGFRMFSATKALIWSYNMGLGGRRGAVARGLTRAGRCFRTLEELSEGFIFLGLERVLNSRVEKANKTELPIIGRHAN